MKRKHHTPEQIIHKLRRACRSLRRPVTLHPVGLPNQAPRDVMRVPPDLDRPPTFSAGTSAAFNRDPESISRIAARFEKGSHGQETVCRELGLQRDQR